MGLWPHLLCSVAAIWLLVRWRQGDGRAWVNAAGIVLMTVVALLWHERAVLIPPLVFGVAVALADEASGWRRITAALRPVPLAVGGPGWQCWSLPGRPCGADRCRGWRRHGTAAGWPSAGRSSARNVVPGLVGGPWAGETAGGAVVPATWVTVVSVAARARWRRAAAVARRAGPPVGTGSAGRLRRRRPRAAARRSRGLRSGHRPRPSLLLRHAPRGGRLRRPVPPGRSRLAVAGHAARRRAGSVGGVLASYGVASALGTALLVPHFQNTEDRDFVTNLRDDLAADPTQVIFDEPGARGAGAAAGRRRQPLLGDLRDRCRSCPPSTSRRRASGWWGRTGGSHPVELAGSVPSVPGPDDDCGYAVSTTPQDVELAFPVDGRLVLRVRYYTGAEATVRVRAEDWTDDFLARRGPNEVWLVLPDMPGDVTELELVDDGRVDGLCHRHRRGPARRRHEPARPRDAHRPGHEYGARARRVRPAAGRPWLLAVRRHGLRARAAVEAGLARPRRRAAPRRPDGRPGLGRDPGRARQLGPAGTSRRRVPARRRRHRAGRPRARLVRPRCGDHPAAVEPLGLRTAAHRPVGDPARLPGAALGRPRGAPAPCRAAPGLGRGGDRGHRGGRLQPVERGDGRGGACRARHHP